MKKFFKEFKDFATRGNVVDLAVGVIIGAAFQKIVTSAVNDLVMPLIGLITGTANFNDAFVVLNTPEVLPEGVVAADVVSLELAKEYGFTTLNYGAFISTILDFIIMAFVIFLMIKLINKASSLKKKEEEEVVVVEEAPAAPTTKVCPYCLSEIPVNASKCAHCTSDVPVE